MKNGRRKAQKIIALCLALLMLGTGAVPMNGLAQENTTEPVETESAVFETDTSSEEQQKQEVSEEPESPVETGTEEVSGEPESSVETGTEEVSEEPENPVETGTEETSEEPETSDADETQETGGTQDASETAQELLLGELTAESRIYAPGETIRWTFVCEGAERIEYEIYNADRETVTKGVLAEEREITFRPEDDGEFTLTISAYAEEETESISSTVQVVPDDLKISLSSGQRYGVAGEKQLEYQVNVSGGAAPYTVSVEVRLEGKTVYSETCPLETEGSMDVDYMPKEAGEHEVLATVTDALDRTAEASSKIPVTDREPENAAEKEYDLTDEATGVSVRFTAENLPEGIEAEQVGLQVTEISEKELAEYCETLGVEAEAAVAAWNIGLYDLESGEEFQPVGSVRITMPIQEKTAGDMSVFRMDDVTELEAEVKQGECSFETEHFTPFVVLQNGDEEETPEYLTVKINWIGDEGKEELREYVGNVTVRLRRGTASRLYNVRLMADDGWETQTDLPVKSSSGVNNTYRLQGNRPSKWPIYTCTDTRLENGIFYIDMTYQETREITLTIKWNDSNNAQGKRPENIDPSTVILSDPDRGLSLAAASAQKNSDGSWELKYTVPTTYLDANGKNTVYEYEKFLCTQKEIPLFYMAGELEESSGTGKYEITNTIRTHTARAVVRWEGDGIGTEIELTNRPSSVSLKLFYTTDDGRSWKEYWGESLVIIRPGEDNNEWSYKWTNLPALNEEGMPVKYRVEQVEKSVIYKTIIDEPDYTVDKVGVVTHTEFVVHNVYQDNWNYRMDLEWNETYPLKKYSTEIVAISRGDRIVQYVLTISVQKPYRAGNLEIRIPYELFDAREGDEGTVAAQFSLGPESAPTSAYNFTYRIEDHNTPDTTDDEVVFYNYTDLSPGFNCRITVEYEIAPEDVVDCSLGTLTAKASGSYEGQPGSAPEKQEKSITCRVDTGVELDSLTVLEEKKVYYWDSAYYCREDQPEDFDMSKYNYVLYKVHVDSEGGNQPYERKVTFLPGEDGQVYRVYYSPWGGSDPGSRIEYETDMETGASIWNENCMPRSGMEYSYYVMVAYPRQLYDDPINQGQTTYETDYHSTASVRLTALDNHPGDKGEDDQNDISIQEESITVHWVDYVFNYTGDIYVGEKDMDAFSGGALTSLAYGVEQEAPWSISMTVRGYNFGNGYSMELMDDAVYARATIGEGTTEYERLTEDDYELSGRPVIRVESERVDRTNGQVLPGYVSSSPFTLWGRRGNGGEWEQLGQFIMKQDEGVYQPTADLTGKGYTALRLTSPEDLCDEFIIRIEGCSVRILPTSSLFQEWLAEDGLTSVRVENLAAYNLYETTQDGSSIWVNPFSETSNTLSEQVGLDETDRKISGAYLYRKNAGASMAEAGEDSGSQKVTRSYDYDVTNEVITVDFEVGAWERIGTTVLPEEVYVRKSQDDGVFYDLLPPGFRYDSSSAVTVYGAFKYSYTNISGGDGQAALESVETIDDYRGSGRQMVIFRLRSVRPDGKNWYQSGDSMYTGFAIRFSAKAGYVDVKKNVLQYNITAYQRADKKEIAGAYTERGYGSTSDITVFPEDENGQRLLYDVNGDGTVNEDTNTLYAYSRVTTTQLQTIQNQLSKTVRGSSDYYRRADSTGVNDTYSYKLRLTAQSGGETSNVVIYDILENAANTDGGSGEENGWKGSFVGINTSSARNLGIDPVVWYSTEENLSYNDEENLLLESRPEIWSKELPDDPANVTAVAFDLRRARDGSDFKFSEDVSVELEIFMKAPEKLAETEYAYNRAAYNSSFRPENVEETTTSFNICGRTTLALRKLQDFSFVKQYNLESGDLAPLGGVEFRLYKCMNTEDGHTHHGKPGDVGSCWGAEEVRSATSLADGSVSFRDLDTGVYAIYEMKFNTDFLNWNEYGYWVIEVDAAEGTVSSPVAQSSSGSRPAEMERQTGTDGTGFYTLLNERKMMDIDLRKSWRDYGIAERPEKVTFDLYRNGELIQSKEAGKSSWRPWESTWEHDSFFKDLYVSDDYGTPYTYEVVERVPDGYVERDGGTEKIFGSNPTAYFYNIQKWRLDISKVISGSATDRKFDFTVTLTDEDGETLSHLDANGNPVEITVRRFTTNEDEYTEDTVVLQEGGKLSVAVGSGETVRLSGSQQDDIKYEVTEESGSYSSVVTAGSASGTLNGYTRGSVTFTNTPQPTELELPVKKTITGKQRPDNEKQTFRFTLKAVTPEAPMPEPNQDNTATVEIIDEGTAKFGPITYSSEGTYEYTLQEETGTADGYTYDTGVRNIKVVVEDNDGKLKAAWTVDGETVTEAEFTNSYGTEEPGQPGGEEPDAPGEPDDPDEPVESDEPVDTASFLPQVQETVPPAPTASPGLAPESTAGATTGDETVVLPFIIAGIASAGTILAVLWQNRKKKKRN